LVFSCLQFFFFTVINMPASQAGSRSVSQLSEARLERKRANDREAQRIIRKRTKDQIKNLKQQVTDLSNQLNNASHYNSQLETQIAALCGQSPGVHGYTDASKADSISSYVLPSPVFQSLRKLTSYRPK
jgi:septal ring factor EnvC (AmiA/AmiB activator)